MSETRTPVVDQIFGHNKAPIADVLTADFSDLIAEAEALVERAKNEAPAKVKNDTDLLVIGGIMTAIREFEKRVDAIRDAEGKPAFQAHRAINSFFKDAIAPVQIAAKPLQDLADDFARRKQAEERAAAARRAEDARRKEEEARRKAEEAKTATGAGRAAAQAEALAAQAEKDEDTAARGSGAVKASAGGVSAGSRAAWVFRIDDYNQIDLNALRPFIERKAIEAAIRAQVRVQKENAVIAGVTVYQDTKATFR